MKLHDVFLKELSNPQTMTAVAFHAQTLLNPYFPFSICK